jgi:hypothetical protein
LKIAKRGERGVGNAEGRAESECCGAWHWQKLARVYAEKLIFDEYLVFCLKT